MQYTNFLRRRTKIVCTIGPASNSAAIIERLIRAGMNVARLNLAHGSKEEHSRYVLTIRRVAQRLAVPVAIIMDIPGPKYRVGNLRDGSVRLKKGANISVGAFITTNKLKRDMVDIMSRAMRNGELILMRSRDW